MHRSKGGVGGHGVVFGEAMGMEGGLRQDDMFSCFKDK